MMQPLPFTDRRRFLEVSAVCLLSVTLGCTQEQDIAPGQIWSYENRAGEGASTIQILHIERNTPLGDVYFVSVRALDVKNLGQRIKTTEVWPLVFTEQALKKSLRRYQWSEKVDRPYLKQLDSWLAAARDGRATERTFTVPVNQALDQIKTDHPNSDKHLFNDVG